MLAEAGQRALRHQHGRRSSMMPHAAVKIIRRLATAIARVGAAAAQAPGTIWPAGPHQPAGPIAEGHPSDHGH